MNHYNGSKYNEIEYDTADLKKLDIFIKPNTELEFVHIYSTSNRLMILQQSVTPDH
jgi:hypothetical protein